MQLQSIINVVIYNRIIIKGVFVIENKKHILLILLLLTVSLLAISCNNTSKNTEPKLPDNTQTEPLNFQVNAEDILSVSIFTFDETMSGEIQKKDDIKELTQILNGSSTDTGSVTDDFYRKLIIHTKNKETLTLIFGGRGSYFISETTQFTHMLNPYTKISTFNQLIDRVEKEPPTR